MSGTLAFAAPVNVSTRTTFVPRATQLSRNSRPRTIAPPTRRANVLMVSETNLAKKVAKVNDVKTRLENSQMIFAVSVTGLTVKDLTNLRNELPEGSSCATVKNTLMRRAIADSKWECAGDLTKDSNLWFFVGEEMKETIKVFEKFTKERKREELKGGAYDGEKYDTEGIKAIAALPSKKELIAKIALSIKMVPTKLARSVNAVPTKLARAVKLAVVPDEEDGAAAE